MKILCPSFLWSVVAFCAAHASHAPSPAEGAGMTLVASTIGPIDAGTDEKDKYGKPLFFPNPKEMAASQG